MFDIITHHLFVVARNLVHSDSQAPVWNWERVVKLVRQVERTPRRQIAVTKSFKRWGEIVDEISLDGTAEDQDIFTLTARMLDSVFIPEQSLLQGSILLTRLHDVSMRMPQISIELIEKTNTSSFPERVLATAYGYNLESLAVAKDSPITIPFHLVLGHIHADVDEDQAARTLGHRVWHILRVIIKIAFRMETKSVVWSHTTREEVFEVPVPVLSTPPSSKRVDDGGASGEGSGVSLAGSDSGVGGLTTSDVAATEEGSTTDEVDGVGEAKGSEDEPLGARFIPPNAPAAQVDDFSPSTVIANIVAQEAERARMHHENVEVVDSSAVHEVVVVEEEEEEEEILDIVDLRARSAPLDTVAEETPSPLASADETRAVELTEMIADEKEDSVVEVVELDTLRKEPATPAPEAADTSSPNQSSAPVDAVVEVAEEASLKRELDVVSMDANGSATPTESLAPAERDGVVEADNGTTAVANPDAKDTLDSLH
ncbi:hypothetical protein HK104_004355, partial [Borealophlyctis nickersoniae]